MGYVMYVDSSQFESRAGRATEPTPLGKAARWVADKALGSVLDTFLQVFLAGAWYVRLAGAVVTGVAAASAVWLVAGAVFPATLGGSGAAVAIGLGAAAGVVMGYSGGLLAGAGAGWLLSVIAESIGAELSKDPLGPYFEPWAVWCLATLAGGVAGWVIGRAVAAVERRSGVAGRVLRVTGYLLVFAATALVLVRTGASAGLWTLSDDAVAAAPQSVAVGIGLGVACSLVAAFYLAWCFLPRAQVVRLMPDWGRFCRRHLPLSQAVVTAMLWTLAVVESTGGDAVAVTALLGVVVWIVPWALTAAAAGVAALRR